MYSGRSRARDTVRLDANPLLPDYTSQAALRHGPLKVVEGFDHLHDAISRTPHSKPRQGIPPAE
jgi:hypothetical protein